jgi:hypothetical protein
MTDPSLRTQPIRIASAVTGLRHAVVLSLLFALSVIPAHLGAQTAGTKHNRGPQTGTLRVWIPAGIIGGSYWIYLNGHIVSAAPHRTRDVRRGDFTLHRTDNGWALFTTECCSWAQDGRFLETVHENWDRSVTTYVDSEGDPFHLFQPFDFALPPGEDTVEVAIRSAGDDAFPFVITGKWVRNVQRGRTTRIFIAVPDTWRDPEMVAAAAGTELCWDNSTGLPDVAGLERWVAVYMQDPMVKVLRGLKAATPAGSKGAVVLPLPPDEGGPREFDGGEIEYIVNSVSARFPRPSQSEITDCQARFPKYPKVYAAYSDMIRQIDTELASFHAFAADLQQGR